MSTPALNMVEHTAVVRRSGGGKVTLAVDTSGCDACGHGSACGLGKLAKGGSTSTTLLELKSDQEFRPGEAVSLQFPGSHMTATTLFGYLFPALALLAGAGLGMAWFGSDAASAIGALLGFLAALLIARISLPHLRRWIPEPRLISKKP
jgi:sigma-E factor negative regulatory protein RseC